MSEHPELDENLKGKNIKVPPESHYNALTQASPWHRKWKAYSDLARELDTALQMIAAHPGEGKDEKKMRIIEAKRLTLNLMDALGDEYARIVVPAHRVRPIVEDVDL